MAGKRAILPQAELTRYAKAMRDAGIVEWRVEVYPETGKICIIAGAYGPEADRNPCDRLLDGPS